MPLGLLTPERIPSGNQTWQWLVGGLEHVFNFSIHWEFHHPNWRSQIFQRGKYTTHQMKNSTFRDDFPIKSCIHRMNHEISNCFLVPRNSKEACCLDLSSTSVLNSLKLRRSKMTNPKEWNWVSNFKSSKPYCLFSRHFQVRLPFWCIAQCCGPQWLYFVKLPGCLLH